MKFKDKDIKNETWHDVRGYEGVYIVSDTGRVKRIAGRGCRKERVLKPHKTRNGYLQCALCKDGTWHYKSIHRLVAEAFIPNIESFPEVNHLDENKSNNTVENLAWCHHKNNMRHGTRIDRTALKNSKPVLQLTKAGEFIKSWRSLHEVERETGFFHNHISRACLGKIETAYGFVWRYE